MNNKFIVTNFAYGTGPYIHTAALAVAFNDRLEKSGQERLGIVVPWVYGDKQKQVMLEEFSDHEKKYPGEILLDVGLGKILEKVFYDGRSSFGRYLQQWVEDFDGVCLEAKKYLSGKLDCETLSGKKFLIDGRDIILEINRSPRLLYGVAPSYSSNFALVSEIMERSLEIKDFAIHPDTLKSASEVFKKIEAGQKIHAIAYPGTFSGEKNRKEKYANEIETPPIMKIQNLKIKNQKLMNGIFVTASGIPGLEKLYAQAAELGVKIYTNNSDAVLGGEKALPEIIFNPEIKLHFARSGWGSVWLSMFAECPLIMPEFDPNDDPEIYFNNQVIEKLGIGAIYRGQTLEELMALTSKVKAAQKRLKEEITRRWGTLDGNAYAAEIFADNFLLLCE